MTLPKNSNSLNPRPAIATSNISQENPNHDHLINLQVNSNPQHFANVRESVEFNRSRLEGRPTRHHPPDLPFLITQDLAEISADDDNALMTFCHPQLFHLNTESH